MQLYYRFGKWKPFIWFWFIGTYKRSLGWQPREPTRNEICWLADWDKCISYICNPIVWSMLWCWCVRWCNVCIDGFGRFLLEYLLWAAGGGTVTNTLLEAEEHWTYFVPLVVLLIFRARFCQYVQTFSISVCNETSHFAVLRFSKKCVFCQTKKCGKRTSRYHPSRCCFIIFAPFFS